MLSSRGTANYLCEQEPYRHWNQVCQHRKGTPCNCICLSEIQHVLAWEAVYSQKWPQATWNDPSKELCKCPSQTTAMLLQLQRYDLAIRYKPGKDIEQVPQQGIWGTSEDYVAFNKAWTAKLKEATREDPITGTVYQLIQQAASKEAHSGWPGHIGTWVGRWVVNRWWLTTERTKDCHAVLLKWGVPWETSLWPPLS